jgi:hypothetical protein
MIVGIKYDESSPLTKDGILKSIAYLSVDA